MLVVVDAMASSPPPGESETRLEKGPLVCCLIVVGEEERGFNVTRAMKLNGRPRIVSVMGTNLPRIGRRRVKG